MDPFYGDPDFNISDMLDDSDDFQLTDDEKKQLRRRQLIATIRAIRKEDGDSDDSMSELSWSSDDSDDTEIPEDGDSDNDDLPTDSDGEPHFAPEE